MHTKAIAVIALAITGCKQRMPARFHASGISSTELFELMPTGSPQKGMKRTPHMYGNRPSSVGTSAALPKTVRNSARLYAAPLTNVTTVGIC
jgi:hypothetical protein